MFRFLISFSPLKYFSFVFWAHIFPIDCSRSIISKEMVSLLFHRDFQHFLHRSERGWFSRCQNDPFCHVIPWKMVLHHWRRRRKNRFVSNRRKKLREMNSVYFDTVNPEWQRWMEENDDFLFPYFLCFPRHFNLMILEKKFSAIRKFANETLT